MNQGPVAALAGGSVAVVALIAEASTRHRVPQRAVGGAVGRYDVGGHRYLSFGRAAKAAARHDARIRGRVAAIDRQIAQLEERREELLDGVVRGVVDRGSGVRYGVPARAGG